MKPSHIEHIGIAVKSLETAIPFYENMLGSKCYAVEEVKDQKVKTAFFKIGQTKIELLESTDEEGPIGKFIKKRGEGIHHIAFAVEDIETHLREAAESGIRLRLGATARRCESWILPSGWRTTLRRCRWWSYRSIATIRRGLRSIPRYGVSCLPPVAMGLEPP